MNWRGGIHFEPYGGSVSTCLWFPFRTTKKTGYPEKRTYQNEWHVSTLGCVSSRNGGPTKMGGFLLVSLENCLKGGSSPLPIEGMRGKGPGPQRENETRNGDLQGHPSPSIPLRGGSGDSGS